MNINGVGSSQFLKRQLLISAIILLTVMLGAGSSPSLKANSADVNVQVVDGISGEPVEFACISNQSHTIGFMADADGRFSLNTSEIPTDSIIVSRIGYGARMFSPRDIPAIIYLAETPTTLQSVTVVPKKRKKMGSMFIPNAAQKAAFDLVSKIDVMHEHNHRMDSEVGRHFKFKQDSRINKIRICLNENDSVSIIFSVYRKVDNEWVNIHDRPIVVFVPASTDWKNIVEVDVSEILEPQPKGEYMVGIAKQCEGRFNMWAKQPVFEDGRERIIGTDKWKSIDTVPGIEIEIEY